MHFVARHWLPSGSVSFFRIGQRLKNLTKTDSGLFCMFVGESPETGFFLDEDGRVSISHAIGWTAQLSQSFRCFIEATAVAWNAEKQGRVLDSVSTSISEGAKSIAEKFDLQKVAAASDDYSSWWMSETCGVGIHPLFGRRFKVTAYWPPGEHGLKKKFNEELTSLLEPHLRVPRELAEYSHFRDTGEIEGLMESLPEELPVTPADSFREAALTGLQNLASQKKVPAIGEDIQQFRSYLDRTMRIGKELHDSSVIYFCAIGLLSYGVGDAITDLLDHMPVNECSAWESPLWAAAFLYMIFPFDLTFWPVDEPIKAKRWYKSNRQRLFWNEQSGKYEIRSQ